MRGQNDLGRKLLRRIRRRRLPRRHVAVAIKALDVEIDAIAEGPVVLGEDLVALLFLDQVVILGEVEVAQAASRIDEAARINTAEVAGRTLDCSDLAANKSQWHIIAGIGQGGPAADRIIGIRQDRPVLLQQWHFRTEIVAYRSDPVPVAALHAVGGIDVVLAVGAVELLEVSADFEPFQV